jgi:hypothetical protein
MHSGEMEVILARYFDYRRNLIVPNISYGLHIHEVDLLVVTPAHYATEVEIKVSIADLKADLKKPHGHRSNKIRLLYFAIPEELQIKATPLIPERAGLIVVRGNKTKSYFQAEVVKAPIVNKLARKLTDKEVNHVYELAAMRIWSLKEVVYRLKKDGWK